MFRNFPQEIKELAVIPFVRGILSREPGGMDAGPSLKGVYLQPGIIREDPAGPMLRRRACLDQGVFEIACAILFWRDFDACLLQREDTDSQGGQCLFYFPDLTPVIGGDEDLGDFNHVPAPVSEGGLIPEYLLPPWKSGH